MIITNNHMLIIILIIIITILVIGLYIILYHINYKKTIPKKIWTYWNNLSNISPIAMRCIDTWKIENQDYEIVVLDNNLINELCGININDLNIKEDFYARHSDIARLLIIAKYGGIWLDSTIICTKSLNWVRDLQKQNNVEFIGYIAPHTTNSEYPIIENWFLAAVPNSNFIANWLSETLYMTTFNDEMDYVNYIKNNLNIDFQNLNESLPYLVVHLCGAVVLQREDKKYKMLLLDAMDDNGPFRYLNLNSWETEKSLNALCEEKSLQTPLIKLRGTERNYIEDDNNIKKLHCNDLKDINVFHVLNKN